MRKTYGPVRDTSALSRSALRFHDVPDQSTDRSGSRISSLLSCHRAYPDAACGPSPPANGRLNKAPQMPFWLPRDVRVSTLIPVMVPVNIIEQWMTPMTFVLCHEGLNGLNFRLRLRPVPHARPLCCSSRSEMRFCHCEKWLQVLTSATHAASAPPMLPVLDK
jgi:hypothetical protein